MTCFEFTSIFFKKEMKFKQSYFTKKKCNNLVLNETSLPSRYVLIALAIGGAVIGGITLIIMGLATALKTVAEAAAIMEKIKHPERIAATLQSLISAFTGIEIKDSKEKQLISVITMQNHAPYYKSNYADEDYVFEFCHLVFFNCKITIKTQNSP